MASSACGARVQQRIRRQAVDLDFSVLAEPEAGMTSGQHLHRREGMACEALLVGRKGAGRRLHEVKLAARQRRESLRAHGVGRPHVHVRIAPGEATSFSGRSRSYYRRFVKVSFTHLPSTDPTAPPSCPISRRFARRVSKTRNILFGSGSCSLRDGRRRRPAGVPDQAAIPAVIRRSAINGRRALAANTSRPPGVRKAVARSG